MFSKIKIKRSSNAVQISLSDPEARNAMSIEMSGEFRQAIEELRKDPPRVLTITGDGSTFSAGGDLQMLEDKISRSDVENRRDMLDFYDSFLFLQELPCPVIAKINGHAIGAGLCMSLACDIRYTVDKAKLGLNFVKLGLHPGMGATYFLPRLVGPARAAELLFSGKIITGDKAANYGLVNESFQSVEELDSACDELIADITDSGELACTQLKQSLALSPTLSLGKALLGEANAQTENFKSEEYNQKLQAIIKKVSSR